MKQKNKTTKIENLEFDAILDEFREILRKNKLKYTKQRESVIKMLYNSDHHFTPEELYLEIRDEQPELNIGIATVYRTLNLLEDSGMVTSISFGTQGKKFELATKPHHDHLICKNCGRIVEEKILDNNDLSKLLKDKYNFQLDYYSLRIYGFCSECKEDIRSKNENAK